MSDVNCDEKGDIKNTVVATDNEVVSSLHSETEILNNEKLIASEIKRLEEVLDEPLKINSNLPFVVRVDGVSFRTYTRGLNKPFDQRLARALTLTSADLLQRFSPRTVFCCSDEISLLFAACHANDNKERGDVKTKMFESEHMYSGRLQKLVSVISSYTAAKFNYYMQQMDWSDLQNEETHKRIKSSAAYFDARAFNVPNEFLAMASIYWRHRYDCLKNSTLTYALSFYSQKDILGKNTYTLRQLMRDEKNFDMYKDAPSNIVYGTFLKKELYEIQAVDRKTGQNIQVNRTRFRIGSFNINDVLPTIEDKVQFMISKYWNDNNGHIQDVKTPEWWIEKKITSDTS